MKFVSFLHKGQESYGVLVKNDKEILDIKGFAKSLNRVIPESLQGGIEKGESFLIETKKLIEKSKINGHAHVFPIEPDSLLLPPITEPRRNIMCIGKNYRDHAIEMGSEADIPEYPLVFTKATTSIIGHQQPIDLHENSTKQLDYEGELAVIIGKRGKEINRENVMDYVFGYSILNDVTARDLQKKHGQFFIGKSLDATCPIGPWIVTKDEIENPESLSITTKVNNEIRQNSNTSNFIFSLAEMIETLSKGMTLLPGDILATGTPAGVGKGMVPPQFLKRGDIIEIEIEKIGTLVNVVD
jgi:2-keto-4-pentenoate hydratase/2-oxohepta-3-ene-1,7-dioic acid hydratase in catechol pathway